MQAARLHHCPFGWPPAPGQRGDKAKELSTGSQTGMSGGFSLVTGLPRHCALVVGEHAAFLNDDDKG